VKSLSPLFEFLRLSVLARIGFAIAAVLIIAALFAPLISPANPAAQNLAERFKLLRTGIGWERMNWVETFCRA